MKLESYFRSVSKIIISDCCDRNSVDDEETFAQESEEDDLNETLGTTDKSNAFRLDSETISKSNGIECPPRNGCNDVNDVVVSTDTRCNGGIVLLDENSLVSEDFNNNEHMPETLHEPKERMKCDGSSETTEDGKTGANSLHVTTAVHGMPVSEAGDVMSAGEGGRQPHQLTPGSSEPCAAVVDSGVTLKESPDILGNEMRREGECCCIYVEYIKRIIFSNVTYFLCHVGKSAQNLRTSWRTTPNLFILALLSSLYSQHTFYMYFETYRKIKIFP